MNPSNYPTTSSPRRGRQKSSATGGGEMPNDEDQQRKRQLHRDLERQRRQEMAALFASLRNLLPLQYIKGKRAVSEHISGAVNFIKDAQERIKEQTARRDELKWEVGSSDFNPVSGSSSSNQACVMVQPSSDGVDVVVSSTVAGFDAYFPLSRVLEVLVEQGLEIICCLSTQVDDRLMHTIKIEVTDLTSFDIAGLQQKLNGKVFMFG